MQHVTARISHVTQVGFPTAQSVRNAALRIRPVQAPTITVVCRVFMTAMVNATRVLIMRLVPADMNIFIVNRGGIKVINYVDHVRDIFATVKHWSVVAMDIINWLTTAIFVQVVIIVQLEPPTQL